MSKFKLTEQERQTVRDFEKILLPRLPEFICPPAKTREKREKQREGLIAKIVCELFKDCQAEIAP